ncbi:MAG: hypothetical protein IJO40_13980 [Thermoguttaceae bacterium]|nr:hypothetical protein [Thermoguttaceae bacterium]
MEEKGENDSSWRRVGSTGKIGAFGVIVPFGAPCRYNLPNRKKKLRQILKKTARRR